MDEANVESTMSGQPRSLVGTIRDGKWRGETLAYCQVLLHTLSDIRTSITEGTDKCCVALSFSRCYC